MKMAYESYAERDIARAAEDAASELKIVLWFSALGLTLTALFLERGAVIGEFLGLAG